MNKALELADALECVAKYRETGDNILSKSVDTLRRQHAEIELLKATASSNYGRGHVDAHSMASARVEELEAEVEALKADRDSWMQQASDRVADAVTFAKEADGLRAEIEALRKDAEWQPIETAPKDGKRILILDSDGQRQVAGFCRVIGCDFYAWVIANDMHITADMATHWKPLPPPPKNGRESMKVIHFPGHIKPYRPGVYRTRSANRPRFGYQKWNGRFWSLFHDDPDKAAKCLGMAAEVFQNDEWWGLAENPKGEKA